MNEFIYSKHAKISVDKSGTGEEVVLFIHAGIADKRMWFNEIKSLAHQYSIINMDLPGFGKSEILGTKIEYTDVIRTVLDYYDLKQIAIVSASFGAKIAIDFCLIFPEYVNKMVLVSPAISGWENSAEITEYEQMEESLSSLPERIELNYNFWIKRERNEKSINLTTKDLIYNMLFDNLSIDTSEIEEVELIDNSLKRIENIRQPILIINGAQDVSDFIAIGKRLLSKIPNAKLKVIPEAAHLPNLENSTIFIQYLLSFLNQSK
ncbi:alpha/beta fold hydrolase [Marinilactibacillus psychrotolerans]|uniref:Alpha/beta fold hydrolase n=1 Tax=Marinilactibacillus psychrotolerans TaxID=191770 RepID=A0ABW8UK51_9LACT|nr:alpha/beta hydrolase [Marinilactibacillus psychrotolerans]GEQ33159.1 hydrolase [Marinilactibacillus psychrotolerans]